MAENDQPSEPKRPRQLKCRVSEDEYKLIKEAADLSGATLASFVRVTLLMVARQLLAKPGMKVVLPSASSLILPGISRHALAVARLFAKEVKPSPVVRQFPKHLDKHKGSRKPRKPRKE